MGNITRKMCFITMYEKVKVFSQNDECALGIAFVGESRCDEKFFISRKNSDITSLEYIVDGKGTLIIDGQTLYPKKGDVFLLTKGSRHKYFADKDEPWHKFFVSFYGKAASALLSSFLPDQKYLFENRSLKNEFARIFEASQGIDSGKVLQSRMCCELLKIIYFLSDSEEEKSFSLADRIKRELDDNLCDDFCLDDVCAKLNYSKNHIIGVFSKKFGKTPAAYIREQRAEIAKDYLVNTSMSVGEIAEAVGIADRQYFSAFFKKTAGISPRAFRENSKK
mgnify:FL=1